MIYMFKVFVYGSLRRGFGNHRLLNESPYTEFVGQDSINGSLYDCGFFPYFIKNDKEPPVIGEVYEVDINTLGALDRLEGYSKGRENYNMYNRKTATTSNGIEVFYYEGGRHFKECNYPKVDCGDWRVHRGASAYR